jgi:CheY-like chemotaxis protein
MTIILYAEMLSEEPSLPPDLAPDLESILDEAQEAAHLVRQVLDFSRRSPIETRPVDLRAFVQESVDMLRRTLSESISLLLEVGSGECVVNADPTRVQQVLMNLVVNARDAMPEGGELRIGLSRVQVRPGEEPPVAEMDAGEWVCLTVSDTGTGIPPDVLPRIFEPFFTTKPKGEGTGLGLAQVYGIVKQHGGHMGVETEVGRGTTFRIYLPAQRAKEVEEAPQEEAAAGGEGETILVAEDEEKVRGLSRRILESLGYRVLTAANGREALEIYRSAERVDLVLTDMVMPEMGGKELIRELRKANPRLKTVAMTGYVLAEDLRELKEEGRLEIVYKPLDTNTLARVVRHALDGDR